MIKIKLEGCYNYVSKDECGNIWTHELIPKLGWYGWNNRKGKNNTCCLKFIHLPMPWDKSLHKLIRDKDGFVVDLESYTPDPREELKVDDKVWVWNFDGRPKRPRYFSSYDKDKRGISTFIDGATSFSTDGGLIHWECWEKA